MTTPSAKSNGETKNTESRGPCRGEAEERRVHPEHHELALREVDDANDAEDQVETDTHEA